jgi:serine/threonine protein kinase
MPAQSQIGDYKLLELAGEGSFGKVWKARRVGSLQTVAVKLITKHGKNEKVGCAARLPTACYLARICVGCRDIGILAAVLCHARNMLGWQGRAGGSYGFPTSHPSAPAS